MSKGHWIRPLNHCKCKKGLQCMQAFRIDQIKSQLHWFLKKGFRYMLIRLRLIKGVLTIFWKNLIEKPKRHFECLKSNVLNNNRQHGKKRLTARPIQITFLHIFVKTPWADDYPTFLTGSFICKKVFYCILNPNKVPPDNLTVAAICWKALMI